MVSYLHTFVTLVNRNLTGHVIRTSFVQPLASSSTYIWYDNAAFGLNEHPRNASTTGETTEDPEINYKTFVKL